MSPASGAAPGKAASPGLALKFDPDYHGRHAVWAEQGGERIGGLHWHPGHGGITYLRVDDKHLGAGVATAMWRRAQEEAARRGISAPVHSASRTPAADAWAHSVGGHIPPLAPEAQDLKWQRSLEPASQVRDKEQRVSASAGSHPAVQAVADALQTFIGSYEPGHMADLERFLHDLPGAIGAGGTDFLALANRLGEDNPVDAMVCERLREAAAAMSGLEEYFSDLYGTWRRVEAERLRRLEDPRTAEHKWDAGVMP